MHDRLLTEIASIDYLIKEELQSYLLQRLIDLASWQASIILVKRHLCLEKAR